MTTQVWYRTVRVLRGSDRVRVDSQDSRRREGVQENRTDGIRETTLCQRPGPRGGDRVLSVLPRSTNLSGPRLTTPVMVLSTRCSSRGGTQRPSLAPRLGQPFHLHGSSGN